MLYSETAPKQIFKDSKLNVLKENKTLRSYCSTVVNDVPRLTRGPSWASREEANKSVYLKFHSVLRSLVVLTFFASNVSASG